MNVLERNNTVWSEKILRSQQVLHQGDEVGDAVRQGLAKVVKRNNTSCDVVLNKDKAANNVVAGI